MVKRTLSGLGLTGFWPLGDSTWKPDMDSNLQTLSVLVDRVSLSRMTALPGSPVAGEVYLVPSGAVSNANDIAVRGWDPISEAESWVYFTPRKGWVFHVLDEGKDVRWDGTDWGTVSATGGIHDLPLAFAGTPASSEIMQSYTVVREVTCPADFSGSYGNVGTNPASSFSIDVQAGGVSIGTITIATDGAFTFVTAGNTVQVIAAGSLVSFIAPAVVDATIVDIKPTLLGNA